MGKSNNSSDPGWWSSVWRHLRGSEQDLSAYHRLALQLNYELARPQGVRSVLLVTPTASALCANGIAELACCLADELGRPILLVDASPRRSEGTRTLGCEAGPGVFDLLADPKLRLDDVVVPTTHDNVFFLPAGAEPDRASHAHLPDGIETLLAAAQEKYDFVLLAGGAVLDNTMALALAPHVGCVLLLVVDKKMTVDDLDTAQDALSFCQARKVGLVFTTTVKTSRWSPKGADQR